MKSSTAARLPLPHTSSKYRRTRALFFSSADTGASSSSLPTRVSLPGRHHAHDATQRDPAHRLEAYSPKCLEVASVLKNSLVPFSDRRLGALSPDFVVFWTG